MQVIRPCLRIAFQPDELRSFTTARAGDAPESSIEVGLETSTGDVQSFAVWQRDVEWLSTVARIRGSLLWQLEYWLPETCLRRGQEVRLSVPDDWE